MRPSAGARPERKTNESQRPRWPGAAVGRCFAPSANGAFSSPMAGASRRAWKRRPAMRCAGRSMRSAPATAPVRALRVPSPLARRWWKPRHSAILSLRSRFSRSALPAPPRRIRFAGAGRKCNDDPRLALAGRGYGYVPRALLPFAVLFLDLVQQGPQLVAFAARGFQIEKKVLDVEVELIDRVLGDADEFALQAGVVRHALA